MNFDCGPWNRRDYTAAPEKGRKADGWISVRDRLPAEENRRVLVLLDTNGVLGFPPMDTDRMAGGRWLRWNECVTHWMPLPEPPKG